VIASSAFPSCFKLWLDQRYRLPEPRLRAGVVTFPDQRPRESVREHRQRAIVGPEPFPHGQRLAEKRLGVVEPGALVLDHRRDSGQRGDEMLVVSGVQSSLDAEGFSQARLGGGSLGHPAQGRAEIGLRFGHVVMLACVQPAAYGQGGRGLVAGRRIHAQAPIHPTDHPHESRLDFRLLGQVRRDALRAPVEQLPGGDRVGA
jgi:hypothetical protein